MMPDKFTMLSDNLFDYPKGEWVLHITGGKIASIERAGPNEKCDIDLSGKAVLPGFIDSHVHLMGTAMRFVTPSVYGVKSATELKSAILNSTLKPSQVNKFMGLDLSEYPDRKEITAAFLDAFTGDCPVIVKSIEGHSALFNSSGLKHFKLEPGLDGVELDAGGSQTGVVRGGAYEELVDEIYDSYTEDEKKSGLDMAVSHALSKGVTGIHCLEGYGKYREREFRTILEYDKTCPIELTMYPRTLDFELAGSLGLGRVGGCELIDGAIGSFTAALNGSYAKTGGAAGETNGCLYMSDEEVEDYYENAFSRNLQPCFHVIGDRAIDQCLSVLRKLSSNYDLEKLRPRLDHFIVSRDDQIKDAAKLGIAAGVQPAFMRLWGERRGKYEWALGEERWNMLHRYGTMVRMGMHIGAGSDSYITPIDPLTAICAMIHHPNEVERVNYETAVRLHTEGCAYLAHHEKRTGKIAPGYEATFTVLESIEPLVENTPENAKVSEVWIRGLKAVAG